TATPPPGPTAPRLPSPTPHTPPMPIPTPMQPLVEYYTVQTGDTLSGISLAYDIPVADLVALNGLESDSTIIQVGQTLRVPLNVTRTGPALTLLPDSEVVYSPAYVDFDAAAFIAQKGGFLATYSERVNGETLTGADIITRLARQYSVGPRLMLALLNYYGGWVTNPTPTGNHPLGPANPYGERLFLQLGWAANRVNQGYYGYKQNGSIAVRFKDGNRAVIPAGLNAGTAGVQNILAANSDWDTWQTETGPDGFIQTYRRLFGDPFARAVEPLVPVDLAQPPLSLPWEAGSAFYYTGGPHAAYADGSAWAAVDFGPPDVLGSCYYSQAYLTAAAAGTLILGRTGETYLDLDGDGSLQTGWVLLYLHMVAKDNLASGQTVAAGTPLGYASCEGGLANSSHLHFARRYNGEWMAAAGPVPMVLSGWQVKAGLGQYEGGLVRGAETKIACECWDETNTILKSE
ncbi:MAG: LysM peptidoglycan-binding domain-containing protein, partial [Anaerolineae bacterium]